MNEKAFVSKYGKHLPSRVIRCVIPEDSISLVFDCIAQLRRSMPAANVCSNLKVFYYLFCKSRKGLSLSAYLLNKKKYSYSGLYLRVFPSFDEQHIDVLFFCQSVRHDTTRSSPSNNDVVKNGAIFKRIL